MKKSGLAVLLTTHANQTRNIRIHDEIRNLDTKDFMDKMINNVAQLIKWIQSKINQGHFCSRTEESLLIYDIQILPYAGKTVYYEFCMLIKPLNKTHETSNNSGHRFQLIVNGKTGEVMNNTKAMLELGLINQQEIGKNGLKPAKSYGSYHTHNTLSQLHITVAYQQIRSVLFANSFFSVIQNQKNEPNINDDKRLPAFKL